MIDWPRSLIREIASRRCVLFLGSGISASSIDRDGNRPKTWTEFLRAACDLVMPPKSREVITELVDRGDYLLALQGIKDAVNMSDYRDLLDECFNNPAFGPSQLHEIINSLDSRIVITTNFDKIYEAYCLGIADREAFKVINYNSRDLSDELRSDARLILKAHGSIDEIKGMVFTRSDYHKAKRDFPHFYEVLKAIFLTHTVAFIGCSLRDPDVLLLLEDVKIVSGGERPHYVITKEGSASRPVLSDWEQTYNVTALEYGPGHDDLVENLQVLAEAVSEARALSSSKDG